MLVVSPHLDDAVLGIGQRMLYDVDVRSQLVTVFAGSPELYPPLVARPHDERCGFGPRDDVMALRRAEDTAACAALGQHWQPVHLPLLDIQYAGRRRDADAEAFQASLEDVWHEAGCPSAVWCPAGGEHPDHIWTLTQMVRFCTARHVELRTWLEPGYRTFYAERAGANQAAMIAQRIEPVERGMCVQQKLSIIRHYGSQLNGITALALVDALTEEVWGTWAATG